METNTKILITSAVVGTGAVIGYLLLTRGAQAQPTIPVSPVAPTTECAYLDESVKGGAVYTRDPQTWPVAETYRGVQIYNRAGAYHIFITDGVSEAANIGDIRKIIDDACAKTMGCPTCRYGATDEWWQILDVYGADCGPKPKKKCPFGTSMKCYSGFGTGKFWACVGPFGKIAWR